MAGKGKRCRSAATKILAEFDPENRDETRSIILLLDALFKVHLTTKLILYQMGLNYSLSEMIRWTGVFGQRLISLRCHCLCPFLIPLRCGFARHVPSMRRRRDERKRMFCQYLFCRARWHLLHCLRKISKRLAIAMLTTGKGICQITKN